MHQKVVIIRNTTSFKNETAIEGLVMNNLCSVSLMSLFWTPLTRGDESSWNTSLSEIPYEK